MTSGQKNLWAAGIGSFWSTLARSRMNRSIAVATLLSLAATLAVAQAPPPTPCPSSPERHQFDFWLGRWDVLDGGKVIATSTIEKSTADCIVHEHYVESGGYSGKSINFFDPALRRWRQTWVDSAGNVSEFSGAYRDGAMRFEGESHVSGGRKVLRRMTLFNQPGGRVRQYSERSLDGGATWNMNYDYEYVRRR